MKRQPKEDQSPSPGKEPESAAIQDGIHQLAELLTADVLDTLRETAKNEKQWDNAVRNPHQFLAKHGIQLPKGAEFRLLDAASTFGGQPYYIPPGMCPNGLVPVHKHERTWGCVRAISGTKTIHDPRLQGGETVISEFFICIEWGWLETDKWYCILPTRQPA